MVELRVGIDPLHESLLTTERGGDTDHVNRHLVATADLDRLFEPLLVGSRFVSERDEHHVPLGFRLAFFRNSIVFELLGTQVHGGKDTFNARVVIRQFGDELLDLGDVVGRLFGSQVDLVAERHDGRQQRLVLVTLERLVACGLEHAQFFVDPIEPVDDRLALLAETGRLIEDPNHQRFAFFEGPQDFHGDAVDRAGGSGLAAAHRTLDRQIGVMGEAHGVLEDDVHGQVAEFGGRRHFRRDRDLREDFGDRRRLRQSDFLAVLAVRSDLVVRKLAENHLLGQLQLVDHLVFLNLRRGDDERHLLLGLEDRHERQSQHQAHMHEEADKESWRIAVKRGFLLTRLLLPPPTKTFDHGFDTPPVLRNHIPWKSPSRPKPFRSRTSLPATTCRIAKRVMQQANHAVRKSNWETASSRSSRSIAERKKLGQVVIRRSVGKINPETAAIVRIFPTVCKLNERLPRMYSFFPDFGELGNRKDNSMGGVIVWLTGGVRRGG